MQHSPRVQPESPSVTSISLSDPCQHTRDQSQLLYFSFSWDRTARAGGSWCCCLALPALCSIPTSENSSLPQWNGKTSPLQGVSKDCLSRFYIHFCYKPPASHYLSLISHSIFGTILSPLPVMLICSGFLELSSIALFTGVLNALQLHWSTVGTTAPLTEGQTPKSIGCETEFLNPGFLCS